MSQDQKKSVTHCNQCAWCEYQECNGSKTQVGCKCGQLDHVFQLKERIDPKGITADNSVYKVIDAGPHRYYMLRHLCMFQRSEKWVSDISKGDISSLSKDELWALLAETIDFPYILTVISNGNVKQVMRTCRTVVNSTVSPLGIKIIYPEELKGDISIQDTITSLMEFLKDSDITFDVKQMMHKEFNTPQSQLYESIVNDNRFFWILILSPGTKIEPNFIKTVKYLWLRDFFDFHCISLSQKEALLAGPCFFGSEFSPGHTFVYRGGNFHQEFDISYVSNFFNVVESKN